MAQIPPWWGRIAWFRLLNGAPALKLAALGSPPGSPMITVNVAWRNRPGYAWCDHVSHSWSKAFGWVFAPLHCFHELHRYKISIWIVKERLMKLFFHLCFLPTERKKVHPYSQSLQAYEVWDLWLHHHQVLQAKVLWRLPGWSLLHPPQNHHPAHGVQMPRRAGHEEAHDVHQVLRLPPQLPRGERHLRVHVLQEDDGRHGMSHSRTITQLMTWKQTELHLILQLSIYVSVLFC